ncbi:MAG: asparaginase [Gemmatimonadaceae bacterium]|nr:asparaginase [Gemmatimonadaceae bacterium]
MSLRIIVTGGTFDKEYDELHGRLYFLHSHVEEMLQRGRCRLEVAIEELMMLDSLDLNDAHRATILDACAACAESDLVITHGTDTMVDTARVLAAAALPKTIVLTGAMIPWAFGSSDGLFNLGSALSFAQALPHGVFVAMNGRCFPWDNVRKNKTIGVFEAISTPPTA